jgi:hypothetical protein
VTNEQARLRALEWQILLQVWGLRRLRCGSDSAPIQRDHIQPTALGGSDSLDNIQPLCRMCNCIKQMRNWDFRTLWHMETLPGVHAEVAIITAPHTPLWLSTCHVAELLGVHRSQVHRLVRKGILPHRKGEYHRCDVEKLRGNTL